MAIKWHGQIKGYKLFLTLSPPLLTPHSILTCLFPQKSPFFSSWTLQISNVLRLSFRWTTRMARTAWIDGRTSMTLWPLPAAFLLHMATVVWIDGNDCNLSPAEMFLPCFMLYDVGRLSTFYWIGWLLLLTNSLSILGLFLFLSIQLRMTWDRSPGQPGIWYLLHSLRLHSFNL